MAVQEIAKSLQEGWRPNSNEEHSVDRWYESVRKEIESEATSAGVETRQYACTLLIGVVGDRSAVFAQIGDGALVIDSPDGYEVVFWPEPNEYLNITEFVTDERYAEAIHVALLDRRIEECAAFTDGLQLLALNYKERTAHQPFFAPMFERLRVDEEPSELNAPLREFLNSAGVNARTDDDKTLILATRRGHEVV